MDPGLLSRIQFAVTIGFHFLFPPISIGLAWLLVIVEWRGWRRGDAACERAGRLFGKLLGLTFAVGVATGIVMEFQFGTNWSRYSRFVGDIFGAPLAAEGVFAFFLESTFLGLYLFARGRLSRRVHWLSILMVAIGATLSAFWIIVANSWMQTPAGFAYDPATMARPQLTGFWRAVFNPSALIRYFHTVTAAIVCGSFFMAGAAAYLLLRSRKHGDNPELRETAHAALRVAMVAGLVSSLMVAYPFGHHHAKQVAHYQPAKFAAMEGLYSKEHPQAPLVMFALPFSPPPQLKAKIELPGLLSWMAFGDVKYPIRGIAQFHGDVPPLWLTFVSFHNMVVLGMFFIAATLWGVAQLRRGRLLDGRKFLWLLVWSVPLPLAACQLGWVVAEVGRQPWIVQDLMRTRDAFSPTVPAGQILFSLMLFGLIYVLLLSLYLYLLFHKLHQAVRSR